MFSYVQTSVVRPIAREMYGSGSYHKLTGEAAEPPAEVPSAVVGAATQDRSLEDAGRRDCQTHMEEEEEESASSSDSSEDVDEHRLLRESSDDKKQTRREKQGSSTPAVTSTNLASSPVGDEARLVLVTAGVLEPCFSLLHCFLSSLLSLRSLCSSTSSDESLDDALSSSSSSI